MAGVQLERWGAFAAQHVFRYAPVFFAVALGILGVALVMCNSWPKRPQGAATRALLVIAHPDDEAMFFLPTIRSLQQAGYTIDILCLSNGGGGGHGPLREKELYASAAVLGIPEEDVTVLDDPAMQDGMSIWWETAVVKRTVAKYLKGEWKGKTRNYGMLVTFDSKGISGHINHRATYAGVEALASSSELPGMPPCYGLETVFILRKFSSVFDIALSWLTTALANVFSGPRFGEGDDSDEAILVLQPDPLLSHRVMTAHYSQYMWFRKLFVVFSRHNHINTLRRIQ